LIINGKFFLPPPKGESDFKELFKQLAAAGAGRPLASDGFPAGPWTPELLAEAISQIDSNRTGVELRTVQLWFQENDKGISTANIRWLARIFGCDDPAATSEWQIELGVAQSRLTAKRRDSKKAENSEALDPPDPEHSATADETEHQAGPTEDVNAQEPPRHSSLARSSEALLSHGSPLNLPASVFAGATALGFLSYIAGIHNATYGRPDGLVKQVGFLWAPNWTILFMVFLPLFFALVAELLVFWKHEGRLKLVSQGRMESDNAWARSVEASSYTYWAVFLICVLFAGLFQWIGMCLIPLINGGGNYAIDWSKLTLVRPEVVSVPMSIVFTLLAYLYMCLCFYLFFVGLILLHTMVHDLCKIGELSNSQRGVGSKCEVDEVGLRVMRGIFRCTILGILIAICMKAQSAYLTSNGKNIGAWLVDDLFSGFHVRNAVGNGSRYIMPTHYSSLLIAMSACFVFLYGSIRLGVGRRRHFPLRRMSVIVALLFTSYLLIDAFAGFSIVLGVAVLLAIYGLTDPGFGQRRAGELGNHQNVS
jgi:hypothetical protein